MKSIFTRSISVPSSNNTKTIEVADAWVVRWQAVRWQYRTIANPYDVAEFFLTKQDAEEFAESLRNAQRLLKQSGDGTAVVVSKSDT